MTRDLPTRSRSESLDDAAIEQLVRETAAGWTMPPVRLDAPSWRERVRTPRARRAAVRGWFGRVGQAAGAAAALTVAGALVAVLLTRTPPDAAKSTAPSTGATPGPSGAAAPSLLPKLLVEGDVPAPHALVVQTEAGAFASVDLATGSIGGALSGTQHGSELRVQPDGSMVCLCLVESRNIGGSPTRVGVALKRYDAAGHLVSTMGIESFAGEPDPRDSGQFNPDQPGHVFTAIGFSADGRYGFVGFSERAPLSPQPVWKNGIVVVDVLDGSVVSRLELPDGSTGGETSRRVVTAPLVVGSTGSGDLLIDRPWYEWSPPQSQRPSYTFESDAFQATFNRGQWSGLASVPAASGCGEHVLHAGALPDRGTWLACSGSGGMVTVVRRIAADGTRLDDAQVLGAVGIGGDTTVVSPDGKSLFAWNPASAALTKFDLATGTSTTGRGPTAAVGTGPLAAVGEWLAPTVAAKSELRGGIVVSPDGSRVYAIGVKTPASERDPGGSTGVYVFDADSLASVGHWDPTADFVSLAVSTDGRFVFAAGLPGVDAAGRAQPGQPASMTVYSSVDGAIRLIAGQLGPDPITFTARTLD